MKARKLTSLVLSASLLLTTSMAWADGWGRDPDRDRGPQPQYHHYDRHGDEWHGDEYRDHDHWRDDRERDRRAYYHHHEYRGYRGHAGHYAVHGWHRGDRLPPPYWAPRYVVRDYDYYGLPRPRPGHCWIRLDDSFVLMAVTTGVILSIVADH